MGRLARRSYPSVTPSSPEKCVTAPRPALVVALEHLRAGDYRRAEDALRAALRDSPNDVEGLSLLGVACANQDRGEEAVKYFEQAARLRPDPERLCNLGASLSKLGRLDEAAAAFRRALQLDPTYPEAHRNFGVCRLRAGDEAEAEARFREALRLRPDFPEALNNLATLLRRQERYAEAIQAADRQVQLRPQDPTARAELGILLHRTGRAAEAVACYAEAVRLQPDHAVARLNRGLALLALGELGPGWDEYEWRWPALNLARPDLPAPGWDGSDPAGKHLLVWAEQGLGDTLHFIRYAAVLKGRGATVTFRSPKQLVRLLARTPGIDRIVSEDESPPACDAQVPLMSLPGLLGTITPEDIPAPVPYVEPDPDLVARWADRIRAIPGFRVGVCWRGNAQNPEDHRRSFDPELLAPLGAVPGVVLVSLQKGDGADRVPGQLPVVSLDGLDEAAGPFMDTAAVLRHLHLVVTCDSALGHLAGAMGVPTWLALNYAADWRWLTGRPDTPWYPAHRLFRQRQPGRWPDVFDRMAAELRARTRSGTARVAVSPGELFDKLTILAVKLERLTDEGKKRHVRAELAALEADRDRAVIVTPELDRLVADLRRVNEELWDAMEVVLDREPAGPFDADYVDAARAVNRLNGRRFAAKRKINDFLGSPLVEEKSRVCE